MATALAAHAHSLSSHFMLRRSHYACLILPHPPLPPCCYHTTLVPSYRASEGIQVPFKVIPVVKELGRTRLEANVSVRSLFGAKMFALNTVLLVPVPDYTAKCNILVTTGKAKYDATKKAIVSGAESCAFPAGQTGTGPAVHHPAGVGVINSTAVLQPETAWLSVRMEWWYRRYLVPPPSTCLDYHAVGGVEGVFAL